MATLDWVEKFENLKVYHIADSTSDHHALLVRDSLWRISNDVQLTLRLGVHKCMGKFRKKFRKKGLL